MENTRITLQTFYTELSPYGVWVYEEQYGYVWVPDVDASFRPYYSNGYWVPTEDGHAWMSMYPWGWVAFHYGRWMYDDYYGWLWVPGTDWGPAWVSWRSTGKLYGWAPMMPGIKPNSHTEYHCPSNWWVFTTPQHLYDQHGNEPCDVSRNAKTIQNSYSLPNFYEIGGSKLVYPIGPLPEEIAAITGKAFCGDTTEQFAFLPIEQLAQPAVSYVKDCTVYMYRPEVVKDSTAAPAHYTMAPQRIGKREAVAEGIRVAFRARIETELILVQYRKDLLFAPF